MGQRDSLRKEINELNEQSMEEREGRTGRKMDGVEAKACHWKEKKKKKKGARSELGKWYGSRGDDRYRVWWWLAWGARTECGWEWTWSECAEWSGRTDEPTQRRGGSIGSRCKVTQRSSEEAAGRSECPRYWKQAEEAELKGSSTWICSKKLQLWTYVCVDQWSLGVMFYDGVLHLFSCYVTMIGC